MLCFPTSQPRTHRVDKIGGPARLQRRRGRKQTRAHALNFEEKIWPKEGATVFFKTKDQFQYSKRMMILIFILFLKMEERKRLQERKSF